MAQDSLRILSGPAAGTTLQVAAELVLGREAEGGVSLGDDARLSRRHARILRAPGGGLLIEDLGSSNGTFVNGERIGAATSIRPGDRIRLGGSELVVEGAPTVGTAAVAGAVPTREQELVPPYAPAPADIAVAQGRAQQRGRGGRGLWAIALAILLAGGGIAAALALTGNDSSSPGEATASSGGPYDGTVYVESNRATPNGNTIIAMRYRAGSLSPLRITEYPTGGSGSADLSDSGVLDADQQLITNPEHTMLFAVNQGSDTIAVFRIARDGGLAPVDGSPFPSGGKAPASLGLDGDRLIVVNKAQDGVRKLTEDEPNYTSFRVAANGSLTPTGSVVSIGPGASPTQALITHDGQVMVSTEEAGPFRAFRVGEDGGLTPGPNSPLPADPSVFPPNFPKDKQWALGMGAHPTKNIVYAEMATVGKTAVYTYDPSGALTFVRAVPNEGSVLPCWTLLNREGTRIYTANAGSDNLTVFDIGSDPMNPHQLQSVKLNGRGNPWNLVLSPDEQFLFVVNPRATMITPVGQGNTVHSFKVGADGMLTELPSSPISLPVPLGTNPIGIAAVANPAN
jgi:DNA-binding beta-propeller fold protein YncE